MCGKFEVRSWRRKRVFTKILTIWKHRFRRGRKKLIHDLTVLTVHLQIIDGIITVKIEKKTTTSNYEEYSNNIISESLKCLVQIYWGCMYLYRKSNKGTSLEIVVLQNSIHAFEVLRTCVTISCCTLTTGKKFYNFYYDFCLF